MAGAVQYAVTELGVEQGEALRMASLYPAEFIGQASTMGRIAPGYRADLVLLDEKGQVVQCWLQGQSFV
jgi:N-acetylglucosamine-6-phosphate deacetylase